MYFINSGAIEVTTKDGTRATRRQGDFFGKNATTNAGFGGADSRGSDKPIYAHTCLAVVTLTFCIHSLFKGEGALLHPQKIRSATIRCKTPVHAIEIKREYFEKYIASSESGLLLTLREKDKIRKRNRAKTVLRLQKNMTKVQFQEGELVFSPGDA
jgi:CRP-like cAMP-binding protein